MAENCKLEVLHSTPLHTCEVNGSCVKLYEVVQSCTKLCEVCELDVCKLEVCALEVCKLEVCFTAHTCFESLCYNRIMDKL